MQGIKRAFLSLLFEKGQKPFSLKERLIKAWWVYLFLLLCALVYEPNYVRLHKSEVQLQKKLLELKEEKARALQIEADLQLQIDSQNDHDWVELVLMRKLGLVPEGQKKFLFK